MYLEQVVGVLGKIKGCSCDQAYLKDGRLGHVADEADSAIQEVVIDSVVNPKWHNTDTYKTLDNSFC